MKHGLKSGINDMNIVVIVTETVLTVTLVHAAQMLWRNETVNGWMCNL